MHLGLPNLGLTTSHESSPSVTTGLLLETGDFILLETGDILLLES